MSAPLSHIVFANKLFKKIKPISDLQVFYIGVCFPDIRYLGIIDKDKTHWKITNLNELNQGTDFERGIKCHILVDLIRASYMKKANIKSIAPDSEFSSMVIKFHEDQIRAKDFSAQEIAEHLNKIVEDEYSFNINENDLKKWHELIRKYLLSNYDEQSILNLTNQFIRSEHISSEVKRILPLIKKNSEIIAILEDFYKNFDTILDAYINKNLNSQEIKNNYDI